MSNVKKNKVSVLNWMGTLFLCMIPGVNILALLLTCVFAKTQAKKSFAIAGLLLILVLVLLLAVVFMFLPDQMTQLASWLRDFTATPAVNP